MRLIPSALFLTTIASPAAAQLRPVPVQPANEREALNGVEVILLNEGASPTAEPAPRQIEVTAADGTRLVLERVPGPAVTVAAGGFAKARYVPVAHGAPVAPPAGGGGVAVAAAKWPVESGETIVPGSAGSSSAFIDRFSPHEPVYGAFGLNDSGGKLQVSLAFQPFGGDGALSHLRLAYTQTMFWRLDLPSGPFTNTVYSPEVYADLPIADDLTVGMGYRHDSNGEGPERSIDVNRIFLRSSKTFDLGNGWRAEVTPQAWFYVGKQGIAPDLDQYWGFTSLTASIQKENGLKMSLTGRGSFETGRGAAEMFVSYPLERLGGGFGIYLFGQAFAGYGEALTDFRRNDTHARIGIAFTR